ncbi:MAG: IS200/IS605 family transposase [Pyrinomonadaceae bacterium]|nr:IS200/IS605 family transposase [Pyrinomonadaceae bacterium]
MAHTYTNLIFHVVFATQERFRSLTPERRPEVFAYINSLITEKGGKVIIINGVEDHLHILLMLPPDICLSDVMRFAKANSSRWFKRRFAAAFAWQKGFSAFSVSRSGVDAAAKYIREQEIHHQRRDFREEFVALLEKNGVEFDPEFL